MLPGRDSFGFYASRMLRARAFGGFQQAVVCLLGQRDTLRVPVSPTCNIKVYRAVYMGEENASFASTLHNLGMAFRAMAEDSKKLEKIPLMERAAESFERCVQIREKVRSYAA